MRERLPQRRYAESENIVFGGIDVAVSFGFTEDGRINEVFLSTRKIGTAIDTAVRDMAVILSIALQYGVTPTVVERSLTADEGGAPEGLAGKIVAMIIARQNEIGDAA
ncbi:MULTISPECIES: hypothetical protein [unclassified Aurantimonas]|uniref:hypothetical protein n=1 Tax=unclassified Aurantimonas TaxID=2638230 RepID=UPI002E16D637|nr:MULTISPECIES: hypothetical protein [unclassified Aurantimonas]MEC5289405.1 hypothetical protein [Aurantimonas sp. C2-3-R2]MEC5410485.1 hypothetical protein [Aurantimonas sp. C2-4-R8]